VQFTQPVMFIVIFYDMHIRNSDGSEVEMVPSDCELYLSQTAGVLYGKAIPKFSVSGGSYSSNHLKCFLVFIILTTASKCAPECMHVDDDSLNYRITLIR
jgi:hypothetical protein